MVRDDRSINRVPGGVWCVNATKAGVRIVALQRALVLASAIACSYGTCDD